MSYTDYELKRASQIAYYKINKQCFTDIDSKLGEETPDKYTLRNLYKYSDTFKAILTENIRVVSGLEKSYVCSLENKALYSSFTEAKSMFFMKA